VFHEPFENRRQFQHFENYLTGLMVLSNKSMANISRCVLESADKTNLSRFFSEAPWEQEQVNEKRLTYMLEQTAAVRRKAAQSCVIVDDTLCEHVGSVFEYVDRHYDHCEGRYPLGHNVVTTHFVSGAGALRATCGCTGATKSRRLGRVRAQAFSGAGDSDGEKAADAVAQTGGRALSGRRIAALHKQFQTKIALATEGIKQAVEAPVPFQTVLMDSWFLVQRWWRNWPNWKKDWVSLLKKNRNLDVNSFTVRDAQGQKIVLAGPHIKVEELVPRIPQQPTHR
jgi:hypothetical protein